ncbi:nucleotide sugar dehydrogenase [Enterocloster hominis (ex Hitch et al. 2024)]|uniref:nucleotide sugar dehydrogenase n=1 Tax=Enterocloster TaxID=2719313 RepID=UPI0004B08132|nr:nucleotide sugar dehydrogenase [Lachnoclostridium pacaense]
MEKQMKIAVAGMGYVGLSNAVLLSQYNPVYAVDILPERVDEINRRQSPVADSELESYLKEKSLNLLATTDAEEAYGNADFVIIATPTDYDTEQSRFDTSSVEMVIDTVMRMNPRACIVLKSTVPLGFTDEMQARYRTGCILFSPEFLREGRALHDNLYPSRIIVGLDTCNPVQQEKARIFAGLLKAASLKEEVPILYMGPTEAEAVKLFSNTYLAMRVAFFNELDTYAEAFGLDTESIINGVCLDPRIGNHYNNPSFGYGGYCLPKDTQQLLANYGNIPNCIMTAIVRANQTRKDFIAGQILKKSPEVAGIYRLTMKADSDNFRHSSILGIMRRLEMKGVKLVIYEPAVKADSFLGMRIIRDLEEFKQISDVILANRYDRQLADVRGKVYTRDLFQCD